MNHAESRLDHEQDEKTSIEAFTLGHDPTAPTRRRHRWPLAIMTVLSGVAALAMIGAQNHREPGVFGSLPSPLDVLVLGDASASREGCTGCFTYVDQLAVAESGDGRRRIRIVDKTMSGQATAVSMPALVDDLRSTPELRAAVAEADVILLAVGSGDVTHPAADCPVGRGTPCPAKPVPQFRVSLTDWMVETETIRRHRPVKLRVITPPPTSGSPRQKDVARTACEISAARDAKCANVYDLARSDEHVVAAGVDPSHPQLTQHGHDLVAVHLMAIGIS